MLSRALAVSVVALLWELVVRWRRPQNTLPSNGNSARIFGAAMVCSWVLLCMGKSAAEEALSVKVCQKLREKLEDSFKGGKSTVSKTWVRTGMATEVGFGLVVALPTSTTAHHADKESSGADSGEAGGTTTGVPPLNTAPGHLLAVSPGCSLSGRGWKSRAQNTDAVQLGHCSLRARFVHDASRGTEQQRRSQHTVALAHRGEGGDTTAVCSRGRSNTKPARPALLFSLSSNISSVSRA